MEGCGHGVEKNSNTEEDVCVLGVFVALQLLGLCVCVDGLCPQFPGKGGSHQKAGQETLTGLPSCSSPDGQPDSDECVCACGCVRTLNFCIFCSTPLDVAHNSFCCFKQEFRGIHGVDGTNLTLLAESSGVFFFIMKVNYFFVFFCRSLP